MAGTANHRQGHLVPAHGIYWPIMLHALGFPDEQMPTLLVHGWWNIAGAKMSKSLGNVVDPDVLIDKYGAEAVRYYLMSDIVSGKDADFSEERLIERLQCRSREFVRQFTQSNAQHGASISCAENRVRPRCGDRSRIFATAY